MNKKAKIFLKEGTGAMKEYGKTFWGYIRDLTKFSTNNSLCILLVQDSFGELSLIPCEDVDGIQYL